MAETYPCEAGCGTIITHAPYRKTRLCVPCVRSANGRNPSKRAKGSIAMKKRMADPVFKARQLSVAHDAMRERLASDPELRARQADICRALGKSGAGRAAQGKGSEPRRRAAITRRQTMLGWCPPHLLPEYQRMIYSKRMKAADARAIVEGMMRKEEAALTPFEKQLRRISSGEIGISRKFIPETDASPFTLGGVSSGML
ncbi:hypothetical protein P7B04_06960 [Sphingobium yanoikuyae]|uniref:hypothetical protein n=1 Tax=Sphingobium yanoikuyae TaxID=13690 RepID=UPI0024105412|nr:hypothetical protein [Sphingobium yanoikuyae]MDG2512435.1 hypothetical protein [Sphingobium yanoikuyae]